MRARVSAGGRSEEKSQRSIAGAVTATRGRADATLREDVGTAHARTMRQP